MMSIDEVLMAELRKKKFKSFRELARYLREREGTSLRGMAQTLGRKVSYHSYIRDIEVGRRSVSYRAINMYRIHFALNADFLLGLAFSDYLAKKSLHKP